MTNHSLRSLAISLGALALVAGPAWSARVVEVRVGNHPTFTRVVFELDAKAGYEIERRDVEGGQELVVTLSAASEPRKVGSRSAMVAGVEVEPSGRDAVARVRLRQPAGLVKELILASPPRIVLDLMLPDDLARAEAPKAAPAPATPPKVEAPSEVAATPRPIEKADATRTEPEGRAPATRAPEAKAPPTRRAETPVAASKARDAGSPEKAAPPVSAAHTTPTPPATPPAPVTAARVESALSGERVVAPPPDEAGETGKAQGETGTAEDEGWLPEGDVVEAAPAPVAKPVPPVARAPEAATPKPMAKAPVAPAAAQPGLADRFGLRLQGSDPWLTFGLVGGGALIFLVVVALLLRRRSRTSLDALEMSRDPMDAGDAFATGSGAGTGMGTERDSFPAAAPGLFEDESEKGDLDMAAQLPIERETRGRMPQTPSGGADSDPGPLVRELERRMTQLESRLDQANEARERLERQVTAQSEELRVQRAAIARTQRALRGMNRGGEEATEPALRDPSKPPTGRG